MEKLFLLNSSNEVDKIEDFYMHNLPRIRII